MGKLTPENVIDTMDRRLKELKPCYDTMMVLSYFLDFAISTGDMFVVQKVHDRIDKYYFDAFDWASEHPDWAALYPSGSQKK